jgi:hypothetical protein
MSGRRCMALMAIEPMPPVAQTTTRNGFFAILILPVELAGYPNDAAA